MTEKNNYRFESVPLPEIVKTATMRLPGRTPGNWVSRRNLRGEHLKNNEQFLTEQNHAFFIGKIRRLGISERIKRLMNFGNVDQGIYDINSILAMLDYLSDVLGKGEKTQVIVCPELSGIFNGEDSMDGHYGPDEEIELIYDIFKSLKKPRDLITVSRLEDLPNHKHLIQELRKNNGNLSTVFAYDENEYDVPCKSGVLSSFEILGLLHKTYLSSDAFSKIVNKTLPRSFNSLPDEERKKRAGYALTEIAVRLSEIAAGRYIHAGMNRQVLYDDVISKILKGKNGNLKDCEDLYPLFDCLKEKPFETLRLREENNFHDVKAVRKRARLRFSIYAAGALTVASGIYAKGRHDESTHIALIEADNDTWLASQLKDVTFYLDGPYIKLSTTGNVERFHFIADKFKEELGLRYQVPRKMSESIKSFIEKWLIDHKERLPDIHNYLGSLQDNVDLFVSDYTNFFNTNGIQIWMPYQQFAEYDELFEDAITNDSPHGIPQWTWDGRNPLGQRQKFMGEFQGSHYEKYYLFLSREHGKKPRLLARSEYEQNKRGIENTFAIGTAQKAGREYREMRERFAAVQYRYFLHEITNEYYQKIFSIDFSDPSENYKCDLLPDYIDPYGRFHFELIRYNYYDKDTNSVEPVILARRKGESLYTSETAKEVHGLVESAIFPYLKSY